jgi:hypothetical protein
MDQIKLSTLSVILGLGLAVPQIFGLVNPARFRESVRRFPRSKPCGYFLMTLGTAWFVWQLSQESISDFAAYKPMMEAAFTALGVLTCIFVSDFLAVRGLAIVLMLLAKVTLDTARWADTEWRLVLVVWAYLWVVAGIWFTMWPWRLRDLLHWSTASEQRIRIGSGLRLAFGLFVAILGLTVF